ncbi:MAG: hypothetical protein ABEL97_01665 [Salinibacter sp.]
MRRLRHVAVWTLLATLIVGGVVGPLLHRVQHALDRQAAPACHAPAVHHSDVPLWTDAGGHVETPKCDLCATRLLVVPSSIEALPAPRRIGTTQVVVRTHLRPAHVPAHRSIRGPPSGAEARPA